MGQRSVEAGGMGSERIHLTWNKGDKSLSNTLQGSRGQVSRGEAVCDEAGGRGCLERGKARRYGDIWTIPCFPYWL